jgi:hypothetical protein
VARSYSGGSGGWRRRRPRGRGARVKRAKRRGDRGGLKGALTLEGKGCKRTSGGQLRRPARSARAAALGGLPCDTRWRRRCGSRSWSSWWHRLAPGIDELDESGKGHRRRRAARRRCKGGAARGGGGGLNRVEHLLACGPRLGMRVQGGDGGGAVEFGLDTTEVGDDSAGPTCQRERAVEALTGRLGRGLAGPLAAPGLRRPCAK